MVVLALFMRAIFHRLINKVTERAATATLPVAPNGRAHKAAAGGAHDRAHDRQ